MHIVKLQGGLGNQMFQYAFGAALSTDVGFDFSWFDDVQQSSGSTLRDYGLDAWRCTVRRATGEEMSWGRRNVRSHLPKLLRKWLGISKYTFPNRRVERQSTYQPDLLNTPGYFEGYFQCERYFLPIRKRLLADFTPRSDIGDQNRTLLAQMERCDAVALHVRRGDYVRLEKIHGLCSPDYYRAAASAVAAAVRNVHFFVFSDDLEWTKQNIHLPYPATFVDGNKGRSAYCDIWLMKHCRHAIIANSSFSWWGAWLNENPCKTVIAPRQWFADETNVPNDIVPDTWIRL